MRTFGWAPTEGELQELVGEIDQVPGSSQILKMDYFCLQRMETVASPSMSLCGL